MKSTKQIFHILSYLQYPLLMFAVYFMIKPYFNGMQYLIENINILFENGNKVLIFMGLAISFSTLQDTKKTSLKFEKKIWKNPKYGRKVIIIITIMTFLTLIYGIFGYFISSNSFVKEFSIGAIVIAIGLISFLKAAIEVFENHREIKDTNNGKKESI